MKSSQIDKTYSYDLNHIKRLTELNMAKSFGLENPDSISS